MVSLVGVTIGCVIIGGCAKEPIAEFNRGGATLSEAVTSFGVNCLIAELCVAAVPVALHICNILNLF